MNEKERKQSLTLALLEIFCPPLISGQNWNKESSRIFNASIKKLLDFKNLSAYINMSHDLRAWVAVTYTLRIKKYREKIVSNVLS